MYVYIYIYNIYMYIVDMWYSYMVSIYIYMVFTTEGFFEIATVSWPEWDLKPRPLNSVQTL